MKTVFIATDFSPAANNASIYATEFAKAFNARVILYHAYQAVYLPVDSMIVAPSFEVKDDLVSALFEKAKELNRDGSVDINVIVEETFTTHESIVAKAKEHGASIIIMGMKNGERGLKKILGSTCISVGIRAEIPMIIVPENAKFYNPGTIALANDINEHTAVSTLDPLKEIGEKFGSKLFITRIIKPSMNEVIERLERPGRVSFHLFRLNPEYAFVYNEHVASGINQFVEENKADMIVMIPHHHDFLERVFVKSNTEDMIFRTHVPLLILPEKTLNFQKKAEPELYEIY